MDVMMLIFKSSDQEGLELLAKNYDRAAERFKALNINSVRLGIYDLEENPPPSSIEVYTTPMIVFLPAYQKTPPFKIYTDSPKESFFLLENKKFIRPSI